MKPELSLLYSGMLGMAGAALILWRHGQTSEHVSFSPEPVLSPERGKEKGKDKTVKRKSL